MIHSRINNEDPLKTLFINNLLAFKRVLEKLDKKSLKNAELIYNNLKILSVVIDTSYNSHKYIGFEGGLDKKHFLKFKKLVDKRDNKVGKEVILKLLISDK